MKRFISILISIILIGITLMPLSVSAVDYNTTGIYINLYTIDNLETPFYNLFVPDSDIATHNHVDINNINNYELYINSVTLRLGSYQGNYYIDLSTFAYATYLPNNTTDTSTVTYADDLRLSSSINFSYCFFLQDLSNTYFSSYPFQKTYTYRHDVGDITHYDFVFSDEEVTNVTQLPQPSVPKYFGTTVFNIQSEDGNTFESSIISHEDISTVIGCDDWIGNELEFNDESGQLQLNVTCPTHSTSVVIPTDIYISPLFVLKLVDDSDGSEIDLPTNGKIVLTDYGLEVTPFESSGFTFIVSDDYTQIHGIPINVYNGLGTTLYGSDLVQGTYLNYNIKVDYWQDSYGNVITELVLTIYGQSDVQTFTISVNLADHDITELKGISFSPNKDIPDIKFEYVSDIAIYTGVFYPSSLTDPLNIYVVTPQDAEIIKIDKSEDLNQALQDSANDYVDIQNKYDWQKAGYKEGGLNQADNAGNNILAYLTGDAADTFNEFLSTIYNVPIVIPMMILVFSIATIAYIFYGKQS